MSASEIRERTKSAEGGSDEALLRGLARAAREGLDGETSADVHRAARDRLLQRVRAPRPSRSRAWVFALAAALVSLAFVVGLVLVRREERPLTFAVAGGVSAEGASVVRAEADPVHVRFDDGTVVAFAPGAKGRIADVTSRGARVILAEGRAHFDVKHRDGASWSVEAGPYVVRVTGTEFDLVWSPKTASLRVVMQRGSVAVEGGKTPVAALVGGNQLDIDATGSISIRSASESEAAAPAASSSAAEPPSEAPTAPSAPAAAVSAPVAASAPPAASTVPVVRWSQRVARGEYAAVVDEATSQGIEAVTQGAPLDDLVALSDAARYTGRGDLSQSALIAIRARFAKSAAAHTAAFLLGRMADDRGAFQEAIRLYDEYLIGGGPFSGEALGRKMIATNRSGKGAEAKALARDYLDRHPDGSYAAFAESLVEGP